MKYLCPYKIILWDYFYEFVSNRRKNSFSVYICFITLVLPHVFVSIVDGKWMISVPILFALLSGLTHTVSLSFMMYLVPYSKKQREDYIQRMLHVKIAVPVVFGLLWDIGILCVNGLAFNSFVLQMASIVVIAYINGTLNDGEIEKIEEKIAYGSFRNYAGVIMVVCTMGGTVMCAVCAGSISRMEMILFLILFLTIVLPTIGVISKRWKVIRSNFADYEMAVGTGVSSCRL